MSYLCVVVVYLIYCDRLQRLQLNLRLSFIFHYVCNTLCLKKRAVEFLH